MDTEARQEIVLKQSQSMIRHEMGLLLVKFKSEQDVMK